MTLREKEELVEVPVRLRAAWGVTNSDHHLLDEASGIILTSRTKQRPLELLQRKQTSCVLPCLFPVIKSDGYTVRIDMKVVVQQLI